MKENMQIMKQISYAIQISTNLDISHAVFT